MELSSRRKTKILTALATYGPTVIHGMTLATDVSLLRDLGLAVVVEEITAINGGLKPEKRRVYAISAAGHRWLARHDVDTDRMAELRRLHAAATQERDEAVALIDAAKSDVRPESFLENAQALLAKCVAPYSCEQMKVVADAMAQWYRKWELMSEVAMKAREDSDTLKAKLAALAVGARWIR